MRRSRNCPQLCLLSRASPFLNGLTERTLTSPWCPSIAEQAALLAVENDTNFPVVFASPWWVRRICQNRDSFRVTAICSADDLDRAYLVTISLQSPFMTAFLELIRQPRILPAYESMDEGFLLELLPLNRCEFDFLPMNLLWEAMCPSTQRRTNLAMQGRGDGREDEREREGRCYNN